MCGETLFVKGTEFGIIQIFINVMKTAIPMNPGVSGSGLMQYCMEQSLFLFILCDWNDSWHPCELVCCTRIYTLHMISIMNQTVFCNVCNNTNQTSLLHLYKHSFANTDQNVGIKIP